MKKIYITLCLTTLLFSCEKENDTINQGDKNQQRIISEKEYADGRLHSVKDYAYDDNGRLISFKYNIAEYPSGELRNSYTDLYKYEGNKIITYAEGSDPLINPVSKKEREIENGIVSKINVYIWNGQAWELRDTASYIYNGLKLTRWGQTVYDFEGTKITEGEIEYDGEFPKQMIRKNSYDNFMQMTGVAYRKEVYSYADGLMQNYTVYYKYDDRPDWETTGKTEHQWDGKQLTKYYYNFSQESWVPDKTVVMTYNDQGNVISKKTLFPDSRSYREIVTEYENKPGNLDLAMELPEVNYK